MRLVIPVVVIVSVLATYLPSTAYAEPVASTKLQITTGTITIDWTEIYSDFLSPVRRFG